PGPRVPAHHLRRRVHRADGAGAATPSRPQPQALARAARVLARHRGPRAVRRPRAALPGARVRLRRPRARERARRPPSLKVSGRRLGPRTLPGQMEPALAVAEAALLDERRPLDRAEVDAVGALPLDHLPDLIALAHRVRLEYCGPAVELESLINAKSG